MKDIYELLNDVNIDQNEFEEMEVNEFENEQVKRNLKKAIKQNKRSVRWRSKIITAAVLLGLSVSALGLTFPTYATSIPIIGDIFKYIDNEKNGFYDSYKEYSKEMNMTEESKGISFTINDAIYDGKTVTVTFSIQSEKDLGNDPTIFNMLDIKGAMGMAGSSKISKVDDNHYVGIVTASSMEPLEGNVVKVKWNIDSITIPESQEKIKGDWDFALSLEATESEIQVVNSSVEQKGVIVNIEKISITPMSFIVYFEQEVSEQVRNMWHGTHVDIEIKDDLGNSYSGQGNGGMGDSEGHRMSWSKTFEKLDPNATKLIITPYVDLWEYTSDNHGSVEITNDGKINEISTTTKVGKGREEYTLEEIIVELDK